MQQLNLNGNYMGRNGVACTYIFAYIFIYLRHQYVCQTCVLCKYQTRKTFSQTNKQEEKKSSSKIRKIQNASLEIMSCLCLHVWAN